MKLYDTLLIYTPLAAGTLLWAVQMAAPPHRLIAHIHESGFPQSHDTYNGMCAASDGRIYYVLCSELPDVGARMYVYDPATNRTRLAGDLIEACGEKELRAIAQGKSHVNFVETGSFGGGAALLRIHPAAIPLRRRTEA